MIAIIDYRSGNIRSVENALGRLGAEYQVTSDPDTVRGASHVILPGVGEASSAMQELLRPAGDGTTLANLVRSLKQPVLGICIGVQLMSASSEEGNAACLGIFRTKVRRFPTVPGVKIPHMGWNSIYDLQGPLFKDIPEGSYVYYVHSFYPEADDDQTIAKTSYAGVEFSAALCSGNFYGTQFHPEKSGSAGARILENFLNI